MTPKWWVLASVGCGTFMATLDSSIVNIALPTLTKELGPDLYRVKWVVIVYLLIITCTLLPLGRLSDQYGRKSIFQVGYFIFILGSALCGLSPQLNYLIAFRVLQGVGASMLMANGPAIITSTFQARERGGALGTLAMVVSAGLVTGPSIGGFLIGHLGWRSIFWVNLPIGMIGIFLVHLFVQSDPKKKITSHRFDWAGAVLQTLFLLTIILFFDPPSVSFFGTAPEEVPRWLLGAASLALGVIFFRVELDARFPLFDLSLLKDRTFWTANLAGFMTFVAYSTIALLMPFFLEEVKHFSPEKAGLFMTAIPLTIFVVAPISGRMSDRFGSQELSFSGALVSAISLFLMAGVLGDGFHEQTSDLWIVLGLCGIGLATGLFQSPNNSAIMGVVPSSKLGMASALLATVRNLGMVTGTGIASAVFTWRLAQTHSLVSALHISFFIGAIFAVGAVVASLGKRRGPEPLGPSKGKR